MAKWRSLVRIVGAIRDGQGGLTAVLVCVPGWDPHHNFWLSPPVGIEAVLDPETDEYPVRVLCMANLGAEYPDELDLSDFETAPEPVPEEEL